MIPTFPKIGLQLAQKWTWLPTQRSGYIRHVAKCIRLLSPRAKTLYLLIILFQALISFLDLIGLALIMKLVLGFQEKSSAGSKPPLIELPLVGDWLQGTNESYLLLAVVGIFLVKGITALALHTFTIRLMASQTLKLVKKLGRTIFENRTSHFRRLTNQDISYSLYNATEIVFRDTLVPVSVISADIALLSLIGLNLYLNAQVLFFPTVMYFLILFTILRTAERKGARKALKVQMREEIAGRALISEATASLRELYVSSKLKWMTDKILDARANGVQAGTVITIGQLRPKYFYEMALFGGVGLMALISSVSGDATEVAAYLTLFVVSAGRMIPSLLRIQYYLATFQRSKEHTIKIFEILEMAPLYEQPVSIDQIELLESEKAKFFPEIRMEEVTFFYDLEANNPNIESISLVIPEGQTIAIVGPSGAGKSTLVDLLLGYQQPTSGQVSISGLNPRAAFHKWPGRVAYVPQKVSIYAGSLFSNVALGSDEDSNQATRDRVTHLLSQVGLGDFLSSLNSGLDTELSEFGSSLSGGQAQRIGIARALFTNPKIVVFDESTSSLDSASEEGIMKFLMSLKGDKTMIFVAHRLSTIRTADRILYLDKGQVKAEGDFQTLQSKVPDFRTQVSLLSVEDTDKNL
jgi:ABC-type multidrug transport system fused ATPase/permease subunit